MSSLSDIQTLAEWRQQKGQPKGTAPRHMWTPFEPFFSSLGYTLWEPSRKPIYVYPPTDEPRTPDGFAYRTSYHDPAARDYGFDMVNSIHCPACTKDNRHVLVRLMAIGQDRGERHWMALSRLATGANALRGDNHIVPMLQEIVHNDMTFGVFPLMYTGFDHPWYYQFSEVLDAIEQILEGINFCHEKLVAHMVVPFVKYLITEPEFHQDIDADNILINFVRGPYQPPEATDPEVVKPFRSLFPVRYYINDFELAYTFDFNSDPASRVVTGLPIAGVRDGEYGRDVAPEMLSGAPYCPFRADVWQLGTLFRSHFTLGHLSKPLVELFDAMCSEDPEARPTVFAALEFVRQLDVSRQALHSHVPESEILKARVSELFAKLAAEKKGKSNGAVAI